MRVGFGYILLLSLVVAQLSSCTKSRDKRFSTWRVTGGSKENTRYSNLDQIDTSNVAKLEVAWMYSSADGDTVNNSQIQCNPIVVDGVLYGTSPQLKLIALDAATGKEKWRFDPKADQSGMQSAIRFILNNNRGVTYWEDKEDKRILYTVGAALYAVNAVDGTLIAGFGDGGKVDLHDGLGRDVKDLYVASTSPGIIYQDLIVVGSRVSEGSDAAPGHIRAYDVRTGKQRWIFHTIPQPGEFGYETWEDTSAYRHIGGANSWSGFSLDEERGILFAPTGSASFDFYGGKRKGANLFANCLLALDAATGKYKWHFQFVHHDVWDKDLPTPPSLVTLTRDGQKIDAVAQPSKFGFVYMFERETGKPLFPIDEVAVPTNTELVGEKLWPTQPIPRLPKPVVRQAFDLDDLNDLVPDSSYQDIKARYMSYDKGNMFTPPSLRGTIFFPGLDGGAEWGGSAFDPATNHLFVNANEMPWAITIRKVDLDAPREETFFNAGQRLYTQHCMACHVPQREASGNFPTLIGVEKKYTEKTFAELLMSGRRMMPAMSSLTKDEVSALASFVLNINSLQKKKFISKPAAIDSFRNLPYSITGYNKFRTKEGYPAIKPPWGTLNAVNLVTGEIDWKVTLGSYPEFKAKGIETGSENYGGPVVTAGGVVFIAATPDRKFRAFHKDIGKLLWETELPVAAFATPCTYEVNGRQYVAVACGGGKLNAKSGDYYVAFALPESK